MSAFKALREVSNNFETELRRASSELFTAKVGETFEDVVSKKLRDLSLFTSKLRLLRAKPVSLNPQISQTEKDANTTFNDYGDTVVSRLVEQRIVKSATQAQAVKTLITAPDRTLEPEMVERKEKIITALTEFGTQEATIQHLDTLLKEREEKLTQLRREWDAELSALRDMQGSGGEDVDVHDPLYKKLCLTVDKLELMRWLISSLGARPPRGYDWLADHRQLLRALKLARQHYSVDTILQQ